MSSWSIRDGLAVVLLTLGLCWYVSFLWNKRKWYIYSRKVPGPFAFPIIGSAYLFIPDVTPTGFLNALLKIMTRYPSLCKFWFGPYLVYLVSQPEHIETLLNSRDALGKNFIYDGIKHVIGSALLTAPVEKWKRNRRLMLPLFGQKCLDSYVSIYAEQATIFCRVLNNYVGKKQFDLFSLISKCTMDVILETSMGVKLNYQTAGNNFPKQLDRIFEITVMRSLWYRFEIIFNLSPLKNELDTLLSIVHGYTEEVVSKTLKKHELDVSADQTTEGAPPKYESFLDLVIKTSHFTDQEIRGELDLLVAAGNDTTATSLTFLFEVLGLFQDVQQKVYEEVIEIMGEDGSVEPWDLPKLQYMDRVIKENLRLFPVAPIIMRQISDDIDLGDTILPSGSSVGFVSLYIHRNPKLWPDPLKFDPDRFLPGEVAKRHPCAYIPFSYGPRNCIGGKYAMMNMKTILSTVIRKYKIFTSYKTIEEIKLSMGLVLRLQDGSKISLALR